MSSEDGKGTEEQMDCRFASLKRKQLHLTEGQLLTIAAAARSPPGVQQLIDSGLPALLTASITGIDLANEASFIFIKHKNRFKRSSTTSLIFLISQTLL